MDSHYTNLSTVCSHLVQEYPSPPFCELEVMAQPVMSSEGQTYLLVPVTTTKLPIKQHVDWSLHHLLESLFD